MRFLVDQDVYAVTTILLRQQHHDVVTASQVAMSDAADVELLRAAERERRVLVTRDRDFGALVFVESHRNGVLYLRISPATIPSVHAELLRVLSLYDEPTLLRSFVVIGPNRHRIRRL